MNEVINKLEQELNIPFYYVSRDEGIQPCIVYNYKKEIVTTDGEKELSKYDFFFILIINNKINRTLEQIEEVLLRNLFRSISINQSASTKDGFIQVSITASKNI